MLTPKEAEIAIQFMNRVELKGSESDAHAYIKSKLVMIRDDKKPAAPEVLEAGKAKAKG